MRSKWDRETWEIFIALLVMFFIAGASGALAGIAARMVFP